jgi:hypothetical protein
MAEIKGAGVKKLGMVTVPMEEQQGRARRK